TANESVPRQFRSPRDMLRGFLAAVDDGQTDDARMMDAARYLDLSAIPPEDRAVRGPRLATDLELVLRGLSFRLDDLPDHWNAPAAGAGGGGAEGGSRAPAGGRALQRGQGGQRPGNVPQAARRNPPQPRPPDPVRHASGDDVHLPPRGRPEQLGAGR